MNYGRAQPYYHISFGRIRNLAVGCWFENSSPTKRTVSCYRVSLLLPPLCSFHNRHRFVADSRESHHLPSLLASQSIIMSTAASPTAAAAAAAATPSSSSPSLTELANVCRSSNASGSVASWSQSAVFEWASVLDTVLAVHGSQTDWSALLAADDKQAILTYGVSAMPLQHEEQEGVSERKHLLQLTSTLSSISGNPHSLRTLVPFAHR